MQRKPPSGLQKTAGPQAVCVLVLRTLQTADSVREVNSMSVITSCSTDTFNFCIVSSDFIVCLSLLHRTYGIAAIQFRPFFSCDKLQPHPLKETRRMSTHADSDRNSNTVDTCLYWIYFEVKAKVIPLQARCGPEGG